MISIFACKKDKREEGTAKECQEGTIVCVGSLGLGNGHQKGQNSKSHSELGCREGMKIGGDNDCRSKKDARAALVRSSKLAVKESTLCFE